MFVIVLEALCYLLPDLFILCFYSLLLGSGFAAKKPAAIYAILAVAVNVDYSVKSVVNAHIYYFLYSVEPL